MFLKVRKPPLKICFSKHISTSLGNGPVPRNLVDSFMFLVPYQGRMCEKSQNENAASTTLKLNRGKSRVGLTRIGRKVTVKKSKKERKKKVKSRDFSDVTSSAGFWRKRAASHCVECMAQLSDATIRAIVLRMLLLTAMAP